MNVRLDKAYLNGTEEVFSQASVSGNIGFSPFVPMENKGMRKLAFLMLGVDLDLETRFELRSGPGEVSLDGVGHVQLVGGEENSAQCAVRGAPGSKEGEG